MVIAVAIHTLYVTGRMKVSSNNLRCKLADAQRNSAEFAQAVRQLEKAHHGVLLTTGALLPALVPEEMSEATMLVIRSERIPEDWGSTTSDGPFFAINGCGNEFGTSPYLVWGDGEMSVATELSDVVDLLYGEGRTVYVAWVTRKSVSVQTFHIDTDFEDYWYCTSRALAAHRFVPDEEYIESLHAQFPPLLSDQEYRFIGARGEPTYVALQCS